MLYNTVGDGDKISKESFGLRRPRFHATSHLKIATKAFIKFRIVVNIFFCK